MSDEVEALTDFRAPFVPKPSTDTWPIGHNLYVGPHPDLVGIPADVRHVVSLCPWTPFPSGPNLKSHLIVPMLDSDNADLSMLEAVAEYVVAAKQDAPVLVHCEAGLNRSCLVVARVLMLEGYSATSAISILRKLRHADALFNVSFVRALEALDSA